MGKVKKYNAWDKQPNINLAIERVLYRYNLIFTICLIFFHYMCQIVIQYLVHNMFVYKYFRYVLNPHKCVTKAPRFFPNWRDIGARDYCMYTTERGAHQN